MGKTRVVNEGIGIYPLVMLAQSFSKAVIRVVKAIPNGETRSYGQAAQLAGSPGAARAVGSLMRANLDPSVPCHRVIKANGRPGGYNRGGESIKARLLEEELVWSKGNSSTAPSMLKPGDNAPNFSLQDQSGKMHSLSEVKGKWALIYFYPKDDTPGCTKEACSIRDHFPKFKKLGITVFGVSVDSVKKHEKFVEKYDLPFTLLADEDKTMVAAYGVWGKKKFMGREYMGTMRNSFLIDPKGKIAKVYEGVRPEEHAEEVLKDVAEMK